MANQLKQMNQDQFKDKVGNQQEAGLYCLVCGAPLYPTDKYSRETTWHCSSAEARFWDFDRGTPEQQKAKDHWDLSKQEIFSNQQ